MMWYVSSEIVHYLLILPLYGPPLYHAKKGKETTDSHYDDRRKGTDDPR